MRKDAQFLFERPETEGLSERGGVAVDELRCIPDGKAPFLVPLSNGGAGLDRVVVRRFGFVCFIQLNRSGCEGRFGTPAHNHSFVTGGNFLRRFCARQSGNEGERSGHCFVVCCDKRSSIAGLLERIRNDKSNRLAVVAKLVILQRKEQIDFASGQCFDRLEARSISMC